MSLNTGAYIAEIVRSGIHAIDPGQREAAKALGMPWHLEMLRIVAPQATKICILPLVNQFIATIKNTSILSAITLTELTREGTLIAYNSFHYFEPYIAVAVLYLILTTIFTQIAGVLGKEDGINGRRCYFKCKKYQQKLWGSSGAEGNRF